MGDYPRPTYILQLNLIYNIDPRNFKDALYVRVLVNWLRIFDFLSNHSLIQFVLFQLAISIRQVCMQVFICPVL